MSSRSGSPIKFQITKILTIFIVLSMFLSACGLNIQVNNDEQLSLPLEISPIQTNIDTGETSFIVKAPYLLASGESIALDIVDEVNGLSNNIQRYVMTRTDDFQYEVVISNLMGSVIKYRYVKIGVSEQIEITPNGSPVRYRMAYINSEYQVDDIIAGWPDSPFWGTTGEVSGVVTSSFDSVPLVDILVCVGGYLTFTDSLGRFHVKNIPIGSQKLTSYSIDGKFQTFQHSAMIMENLLTSAQIQMLALPKVDVTFIVVPPGDAVGAPIKIAGNFIQLGNTFADLRGGVNLLSARIPLMTKLDDGRYSITLRVHGGNDLRYKYTLGDSQWNSEHDSDGRDGIRQLLVPKHDVVIEDTIITWRQNGSEPFVVEVTTPPETPVGDTVSIQFYSTEWSEPIPMWPLSNNQWLLLLFSPMPDPDSSIYYRFCRNDQCDLSSDQNSEVAPFVLSPGMPLQQSILLTQWKNWDPILSPTTVVAEIIEKRDIDFITGVEFDPTYHPTQQSRFPIAIQNLSNIGTNAIILTPTWQVDLLDGLPQLEFQPGSDIFINNLNELVDIINKSEMEVILFPVLDLNTTNEVWWQNGSQNPLWWHEWYKEYTNYLESYAHYAQIVGADKLIIGGESIIPSFPGGILPSDTHSGTPVNALGIWQDILLNIREIYSGELVWALPYQDLSDDYLLLIDHFDSIYLLFNPPITDDNATGDLKLLGETVTRILDNDLEPFTNNLNLPIYIGISYASADGAGANCITSEDGSCKSGLLFSATIDDIPMSALDLQEQVDLYNVISKAVMEREWIDGFISRGFNSSVKLTDPSSSINGKPAMDVLWYWYSSIK